MRTICAHCICHQAPARQHLPSELSISKQHRFGDHPSVSLSTLEALAIVWIVIRPRRLEFCNFRTNLGFRVYAINSMSVL